MRSASAAFKRALFNGRHDYQTKIYITLADSTVIYGTETEYDHDTGDEAVTQVGYLTNENIMEGGLSLEDAVSDDDAFQFGSAIVNQATIVINNLLEEYSDYDFIGANVVVYVGLRELDDGQDEYLKMGTYIVDEADFSDGEITLTCYDYMSKFDKLYVDHISYDGNVYIGELINDCCSRCGVVPNTSTASLVTRKRSVYDMVYVPASDDTTYRTVLSWLCQISAFHFARCNADGELCLGRYGFRALNFNPENCTPSLTDLYYGVRPVDGGLFDNGSPSYASGDNCDGGTFNPWGEPRDGFEDGNYVVSGSASEQDRYNSNSVHILPVAFTKKIAVKDTVITGIRVVVDFDLSLGNPAGVQPYSKVGGYSVGQYAIYNDSVYQCTKEVPASGSPIIEFDEKYWSQVTSRIAEYGDADYVIEVSGNKLLCNASLSYLMIDINDLVQPSPATVDNPTFRIANITIPSDPTIEAGDVAAYYDEKGRRYNIIVSSTKFTIGGQQTITSSAASNGRNGTTVSSGGSGGGSFAGGVSSLLKVYPVGAVYMSVNNTDPGTLFGGTWGQIQNSLGVYMWKRTA